MEEKLFCQNCGKELRQDAEFCPYCGASVNSNTENQPSRQTGGEQEIHRGESSHRVLWIVCTAAAIAAAAAVGIFVIAPRLTNPGGGTNETAVLNDSSSDPDHTDASGTAASAASGTVSPTETAEASSAATTAAASSAAAVTPAAAQTASPTAAPTAIPTPAAAADSSSAAPAQTADDPAYDTTLYVVNCREWITLRQSPDTSSASLRQIPLGDSVTFLGNAENGFYHIVYLGTEGYALAQYLSSGKTNTSPLQNQAVVHVVNCSSYITLRDTPSTSGADLAHIPLGAAVTFVSDASNGFYEVIYNGEHGYALGSYLS